MAHADILNKADEAVNVHKKAIEATTVQDVSVAETNVPNKSLEAAKVAETLSCTNSGRTRGQR